LTHYNGSLTGSIVTAARLSIEGGWDFSGRWQREAEGGRGRQMEADGGRWRQMAIRGG